MRTLFFIFILLPFVNAFAKSDVNFSGTLVQEPCTLSPDSSDIMVDFRSVIIPYLYANSHSPREIFRIHLMDCDTSIGALGSVTFTGDEDISQPGLLALGGGSLAKGVAIGIETLSGEPVEINNPSKKYLLIDGNTTLYFSAYVKASPLAKQNQTVIAGSFNAIATFEINYE